MNYLLMILIGVLLLISGVLIYWFSVSALITWICCNAGSGSGPKEYTIFGYPVELITAIAGLITAIAGLILALYQLK